MSLATIINDVALITGVTDPTRVTAAVRSAARSLWQAAEFPGELQEIRIQVYSADTSANRYATTPYDVHEIRRIKLTAARAPVEYGNVSRDYDGWMDIQDLCQVRLVRNTPLSRRITNATRLTFTRKQADANQVLITVGGITDVASYAEETVTIEASATAATSLNRYTDVRAIVKSAISNADINVTTADGTEVSFLPNHLTSPRFKLFELRGASMAYADQFMGIYDILYKPVLPEITATVGYFPYEFELPLMWLAVSHLYMSQEDKIAQGSHYNRLATDLLSNFQENETLGKRLKRPTSVNSFITPTSGRP